MEGGEREDGPVFQTKRQLLENDTKMIGCQEKSTKGRFYKGNANTTVDGIPCQKWSERTPHNHSFTDIGDHNFCRNPHEASESQVWCFTTDPDQERSNCSVPFCPPLKALDFSLDNDMEKDENGSYTKATLKKEGLPTSFTICAAQTVEAWTKYINSKFFLLDDEEGDYWLFADLYAVISSSTYSYKGFVLKFADSQYFIGRSDDLFYPLQWTRMCFSISADKTSGNSTIRMVGDGKKWIEESWKVKNKPDNLNLRLNGESPGRKTNLNIFSSALPVEQMISMTSPGKEECGLEGDFLSWEKSFEENLWNLSSQARWMDLDGGFDNPCTAKSSLNVFPMDETISQWDCMKHCKKLGGHPPSLKTQNEWEYFWGEMKALGPDPAELPIMYLSATEGVNPEDDNDKLGEPSHWPEGVTATEGVWRDYSSGEILDNYTKPWRDGHDRVMEDLYNCVFFYPKNKKEKSWLEWQCSSSDIGCPCAYQTAPLIRLRGYCPSTYLDTIYSVTQLAADPKDIIIMGSFDNRIQYNSTLSQ